MNVKKNIVIKIGGALIAQDITNLVKDIKNLISKYNFIIVHGGGPQINDTYKKLGKNPKIFKTPKGYSTRYSDPEAIDIVKMALAGYVNKTLVEVFQKEGINAFGFIGADGKTIVADRKDKIMILTDEGKRLVLRNEYSGKEAIANPKIISFLLENNYLPVIGSTSISNKGELLNLDGDRVANAIANSLKIDTLISLTDVEGIYRNLEAKDVIKKLKLSETEILLQKLEGGMKKKLFAAINSLKSGINEIIITSGIIEQPLTKALEENGGTRIKVE
ncbi:MAG: [LysW]-aminoadipate/[LysW]-glutamate kinase [archaeon]|nr:[LysW]-aminoadipate/[LysW]-glutamate kinase [archaeon]